MEWSASVVNAKSQIAKQNKNKTHLNAASSLGKARQEVFCYSSAETSDLYKDKRFVQRQAGLWYLGAEVRSSPYSSAACEVPIPCMKG